MPTQDTNKRINPNQLAQGTDVLSGLRTLANYSPQRREASITYIEAAQKRMQAAQDAEAQIKVQYRTTVEAAREAEWEFHNCILEAKAAVIAQYGADSNQVQAVGRKKKSAYKRPTRQKKNVPVS